MRCFVGPLCSWCSSWFNPSVSAGSPVLCVHTRDLRNVAIGGNNDPGLRQRGGGNGRVEIGDGFSRRDQLGLEMGVRVEGGSVLVRQPELDGDRTVEIGEFVDVERADGLADPVPSDRADLVCHGS